jgi:hypothetical protein
VTHNVTSFPTSNHAGLTLHAVHERQQHFMHSLGVGFEVGIGITKSTSLTQPGYLPHHFSNCPGRSMIFIILFER